MKWMENVDLAHLFSEEEASALACQYFSRDQDCSVCLHGLQLAQVAFEEHDSLLSRLVLQLDLLPRGQAVSAPQSRSQRVRMKALKSLTSALFWSLRQVKPWVAPGSEDNTTSKAKARRERERRYGQILTSQSFLWTNSLSLTSVTCSNGNNWEI